MSPISPGGLIRRLLPGRSELTIRKVGDFEPTVVDSYWSEHTVNSSPFESAQQSADYLDWRNRQYPLFPEFMEMWGNHRGETVLDYGCGPGNDLVGFLLHGRASKVIGMDVSAKALGLAEHRLKLHGLDGRRAELLQTGDSAPTIALEDASVDYVNCSGVLHHTSTPEAVLAEFARVLTPAGRGCIMVYNRQSIWFHLYVAYVRMLVEGAFPGHSLEEAFRRSTDGEDCPVSIAYRQEDFIGLLGGAGFAAEFVGGYLSIHELKWLEEHREPALADPRLGAEQHRFLAELTFDGSGYPMWGGRHAGIGGVYRFRKG